MIVSHTFNLLSLWCCKDMTAFLREVLFLLQGIEASSVLPYVNDFLIFNLATSRISYHAILSSGH